MAEAPAANGSRGGLASLFEQAKVALKLRHVSSVGARARVVGRPHVSNGGSIEIGDDFQLISRPATSHLVVLEGGSIKVGDRVRIESGASISSLIGIVIGDDVRIGPYVVIMDSDFHVVGNRDARPVPQPVQIGNRVVIEHRVTILRGSKIGNGARVQSGSVVAGDVPEGAVVSGVPASTAGSHVAGENVDLPSIVQRVFGLERTPDRGDGPDTIPQWDSLGALKLLLAIERQLGASLGDGELRAARTIGELETAVAVSLGKASESAASR